MADRAHIRSGKLIREYQGEKHKIELENGEVVLSCVIGFSLGNDKIVALVSDKQDTSTGSDKHTTRETVIEKDRVVKRETVRDKTQKEIDDNEAARKISLTELFDADPMGKALFDTIWRVQQGNIPAKDTADKAAFRKYFLDLLHRAQT